MTTSRRSRSPASSSSTRHCELLPASTLYDYFKQPTMTTSGNGAAGASGTGPSARGKHGPVKLPAFDVQKFSDYFKDVSLLEMAPSDRLIEAVDADFPFLTHDKIRKMIRSGLLSLYYSKLLGLSIPLSDFNEDNVGVLQGSDILVFRSLNMVRSVKEVGNCYEPFRMLLEALICKYVSTEAILQLPKGLDLLMKYLEMPVVKDYTVIYNPFLFSRQLSATMYFEVHRLVREQFPARGLGSEAILIMKNIESKLSYFMQSCSTNPLLISYSGAHGEKYGLSTRDFSGVQSELAGIDLTADQGLVSPAIVRQIVGKDLSIDGKRTTKDGEVRTIPGAELFGTLVEAADVIEQKKVGPYKQMAKAKRKVCALAGTQRNHLIWLLTLLQQQGLYKDITIDSQGPKDSSVKLKAPFASAIVDTHRHGVAHAVQTDNVHLVNKFPEINQESLKKKPYDLYDVVDLFLYKFSEYLTIAVEEFDDQDLWVVLDLPTRFPIPDIYFLSSCNASLPLRSRTCFKTSDHSNELVHLQDTKEDS